MVQWKLVSVSELIQVQNEAGKEVDGLLLGALMAHLATKAIVRQPGARMNTYLGFSLLAQNR